MGQGASREGFVYTPEAMLSAALQTLSRDLRRAARDRGWSAQVSASPEGVTIAVQSAPGPFTLRLLPREWGAPCLLTTQRLGLAYLGADGTLPAAGEAWARSLKEPLSAWERDLAPGALAAHLAALVAPGAPSAPPPRPDPAPVLATVKLSARCQLHCTFCRDRTGEGAFRRGVSEWQQVVHLLDRAARAGANTVTFDGGEPTLSPLLGDAVSYARRAGFRHVAVTTNGLRLADAKFLMELVRAGLSGVNLSVHALEPDLAHRLLGRDTTALQRRAMAHIRAAGPALSLTVSSVLVEENRAALDGLLAELRTLPPSQINVLYVLPGAVRALRGQVHTASLEHGDVQDALRRHVETPDAPPLRLRHFPLCRLPRPLWDHVQARGRIPANEWRGRRSPRRTGPNGRLCPRCSQRRHCDFPLLWYLMERVPLSRIVVDIALAPLGRGALGGGDAGFRIEP